MADAEIPPIHARQAECRVEIDSEPELKFSLKEWENNFKRALDRIENKRTRALNVKNELYQLIGFYSVFQGVVLTAVAQASTLKCQTAWGPLALSAIVSIGTLFSFHNKVVDNHVLKAELKKEEEDANVTKEKISLLKLMGAKFDFAVLDQKAARKRAEKPIRDKYYWPNMILLVLFSIITLMCCVDILCSDKNLVQIVLKAVTFTTPENAPLNPTQ